MMIEMGLVDPFDLEERVHVLQLREKDSGAA